MSGFFGRIKKPNVSIPKPKPGFSNKLALLKEKVEKNKGNAVNVVKSIGFSALLASVAGLATVVAAAMCPVIAFYIQITVLQTTAGRPDLLVAGTAFAAAVLVAGPTILTSLLPFIMVSTFVAKGANDSGASDTVKVKMVQFKKLINEKWSNQLKKMREEERVSPADGLKHAKIFFTNLISSFKEKFVSAKNHEKFSKMAEEDLVENEFNEKKEKMLKAAAEMKDKKVEEVNNDLADVVEKERGLLEKLGSQLKSMIKRKGGRRKTKRRKTKKRKGRRKTKKRVKKRRKKKTKRRRKRKK